MQRGLTIAALAATTLYGGIANAKPPTWVVPAELPDAKAAANGEGDRCLLSDLQVRRRPSSIEKYWHWSSLVQDEESAKQWTKLWLDERTVAVDFIHVIRGKRVIDVRNRLTPAESEGSTYLTVDLPEILAGDIIDFATVAGESVPGPEISGMLSLSDDADCVQRRVRLLVSAKANVAVKLHGPGPELERAAVGGYVEYVWEPGDYRSIVFEPSAPGWYVQSPFLQYSNVESWESLGTQLAGSLSVTAAPDEAVTELAATLGSMNAPTELEKAMTAARFVQQNIARDWTVPLTAPPRPLADVLRTKSGTAVERALLISALSRSMGLEAGIGLASDRYRDHLEDLLPALGAFDTALAGIVIDGQLVWVDPDGSDVRAEGFQTPPVEKVLRVDPTASGIVGVPLRSPLEPTVDILEDWKRDGDGARISVTTTFRGDAAVEARSQLSDASAEDLGRWYLERFKDLDPSIEMTDAMRVEDDAATGRLIFVESYRVPKFWIGGVRTFKPVDVIGAFVIPDESRPRVPLALPHPVHTRQQMRIELPPEFDLEPEQDRVDSEWYSFEMSQRTTGNTMYLSWTYRSAAPYVPADRLDDYQRALDTPIYYEYALQWLVEVPGEPYWPRFLMVVAGFVILGGALQTIERKRIARRASARVVR
jgi:hypothetical protein